MQNSSKRSAIFSCNQSTWTLVKLHHLPDSCGLACRRLRCVLKITVIQEPDRHTWRCEGNQAGDGRHECDHVRRVRRSRLVLGDFYRITFSEQCESCVSNVMTLGTPKLYNND